MKIILILASAFLLLFILSFFVPKELFVVIITATVVICFVLLFVSKIKKNNQNYWTDVGIIVGFGLTILGWFVNSYVNNVAEVNKTKRELKTKFLLNAYYRIENFVNRLESGTDGYIYGKSAESALAIIGLLGDTSTLRLANTFIMTSGRLPGPLLLSLRRELRKELNLTEIPELNSNSSPSDSLAYGVYDFRFVRRKILEDTMTYTQQVDLIMKLTDLHLP